MNKRINVMVACLGALGWRRQRRQRSLMHPMLERIGLAAKCQPLRLLAENALEGQGDAMLAVTDVDRIVAGCGDKGLRPSSNVVTAIRQDGTRSTGFLTKLLEHMAHPSAVGDRHRFDRQRLDLVIP